MYCPTRKGFKQPLERLFLPSPSYFLVRRCSLITVLGDLGVLALEEAVLALIWQFLAPGRPNNEAILHAIAVDNVM